MTIQRSRSTGRPTLEEVAARAGVGRGTVSRVVNDSPKVSSETKAAVQKAIDELGYVPNRAARALVTQRTDSVALVVSESEARVFGEPFFAGIIRGISGFLSATPLQLWLAMAQSPQERERVDHYLTRQHVDGVMLLSLHDDDTLPARLRERHLPAIRAGHAGMPASGAVPMSFVDVDNTGGARLAVQHLAGLGRRKIAVIAGPQDMGVGIDRLTGYRDAIVREGLTPDERLVRYGDFSEESGAAAMRSLLAARPGVDAVFAASDLMAVGAMRVLKETGRKIPVDVAVIGFEDSVLAKQTDPPLTTVHQPVEEMGREMARLLLDLIRGEAQPDSSVTLDTHLVRRSSA